MICQMIIMNDMFNSVFMFVLYIQLLKCERVALKGVNMSKFRCLYKYRLVRTKSMHAFVDSSIHADGWNNNSPKIGCDLLGMLQMKNCSVCFYASACIFLVLVCL